MSDILFSKTLPSKDGFDLRFDALIESMPLKDVYEMSDTEYQELRDKVYETYELAYFCARFTASKHGIELGTTYLGACLYDDYDSFIADQPYLIDEAIEEAKRTIKKLTEEV